MGDWQMRIWGMLDPSLLMMTNEHHNIDLGRVTPWVDQCLFHILILSLSFLIFICFPLLSFCLALILVRILRSHELKYGISTAFAILLICAVLFFWQEAQEKGAPSSYSYVFIPVAFFLAGILWGVFLEKRYPLEGRFNRLYGLFRARDPVEKQD